MIEQLTDTKSLEERARSVLSKGVRKKRFRRLKSWDVKNRFLLGLLFAEDIKISDFAGMMGVSHRAVNAWIYEGTLPGRSGGRRQRVSSNVQRKCFLWSRSRSTEKWERNFQSRKRANWRVSDFRYLGRYVIPWSQVNKIRLRAIKLVELS